MFVPFGVEVKNQTGEIVVLSERGKAETETEMEAEVEVETANETMTDSKPRGTRRQAAGGSIVAFSRYRKYASIRHDLVMQSVLEGYLTTRIVGIDGSRRDDPRSKHCGVE
ncbi:hypothetical protein PG996_000623 [Apiospora saccharicola]|uniref:Uncharacterized protein n=1 Tax=Apiospora saccharicola TaxID=335842 RepID=A0ABR1WE98_9PEZI